MDKSSLEALIRWLEIWSAVFGLIVVIGVAGESFFGIRLLWNTWKLQHIQNAEATEAQRKLVEAERDLEELRAKVAWRHINRDKFLSILKDRPKPTRTQIMYLREDPESWNLAMEIGDLLFKAGWPVALPIPIAPSESRLFALFPPVMGVGGNPFGGISLVTNEEFKSPIREDKTAIGVLAEAFMQALGGQVSFKKPLPEQGILPAGAIRIVVGPRMDPAMSGRIRSK